MDMVFREEWRCLAILSLSDGDVCDEGEGGSGGGGGGGATEGDVSSVDDGCVDSLSEIQRQNA